jgi:cytochrome c oxidase cbb3-type subunit I/II
MTARRLVSVGLCIAVWFVVGGNMVGCKEAAPQFTAPMELGGVEVGADVLNRGAHVYAMRCASCHGNDGSGNGPSGRALREPPRDFRDANFKHKTTPGDALPTDSDLERVVTQGLVEQGMPAWPGMSAEDRHAVVQYIKTFSARWRESG